MEGVSRHRPWQREDTACEDGHQSTGLQGEEQMPGMGCPEKGQRK